MAAAGNTHSEAGFEKISKYSETSIFRLVHPCAHSSKSEGYVNWLFELTIYLPFTDRQFLFKYTIRTTALDNFVTIFEYF